MPGKYRRISFGDPREVAGENYRVISKTYTIRESLADPLALIAKPLYDNGYRVRLDQPIVTKEGFMDAVERYLEENKFFIGNAEYRNFFLLPRRIKGVAVMAADKQYEQ